MLTVTQTINSPLIFPVVVVVIILVMIVQVRRVAKTRGTTAVVVGLFAVGCLLLAPLLLTLLYLKAGRPTGGNSAQIATRSETAHVWTPADELAVTGTIRNHENAMSGVWVNLNEQPFEANVYPGRTAAAKPLARKIRAALDANQLLAETAAAHEPFPDGDDALTDRVVIAEAEAGVSTVTRLTTPAWLMLYGSAVGKEVQQQFAEQLQAEFPISELRVAQQGLSPREAETAVEIGAVRLVLRAVDEHIQMTEHGQRTQQIQGRLSCDIVTSEGSAQVHADYIRKPWVEDFDVYVSTRPQQHFVVGYSRQLVSSEEEARRLALRDAQDKSRISVGGVIVTPDESYVVDRFTQKLSRPYGDVWREAVLLDVTGDRMAAAIDSAQRHILQQRQARSSNIMGLATLFGVATFLCVILNLLTEGYYRRGLLIVGGIVALMVLFLVLAQFNDQQIESATPAVETSAIAR